MKRGLRVALAIAILAIAGFLAWKRFVGPRGPTGPGPAIEGSKVATSGQEKAPATRIAPGPVSPAGAARAAASGDRIEGVIYDDADQPVGDAEVQIVRRSF